MAVSLSKAPQTLNPAGNSIIVEVASQSSDIIIESGTLADCAMSLPHTCPLGGSFIFVSNIFSVKFTCVNSVNESGTQFRKYVSGEIGQWKIQVASDLALNSFVNEFYIVTSEGETINFTARNKGTAYNCYIADNGFAPSGATSTSTNGTDDQTINDYKHYLNILINNVIINRRLKSIDAAYKSEFDISEILKLYSVPGIEFPDNTSDAFLKKYTDFVKSFTIRYGSRHTNNYNHTYSAGPFYFFNGGLADANAITDFLIYLNSYKKFLSVKAGTRPIAYYGTERLYYIAHMANVNNVVVSTKGIFDSTWTDHISKKITVSLYELVEVKVSTIVRSGMITELNDFALCLKFYNASNALLLTTETINYSFKTDYSNLITILYINSYGVYETYNFWGELVEKSLDFEHNYYDYLSQNKKYIGKQKSNRIEKYKINTGFLTHNDIEIIDEILSTEKAFLILNNKLIDIVFLTKQISRFSTKKEIENFCATIEFRRAYEEEFAYFDSLYSSIDFAPQYNHVGNAVIGKTNTVTINPF